MFPQYSKDKDRFMKKKQLFALPDRFKSFVLSVLTNFNFFHILTKNCCSLDGSNFSIQIKSEWINIFI